MIKLTRLEKDRGWVKWLAFSCPHCPLEDENAVDWMIDWIKKYKPNYIIHLGDGHEAESASRWPSENDWALEDEFRSHDALLYRVRRACGKTQCKRIFLQGNHDDNLISVNRIDRKLRGLCDFRRHEKELSYWRQFPYNYARTKGVFRLGQVTFSHGYEANEQADKYHATILGVPFGLYVGGHTHRPNSGNPVRVHLTQSVPLPYWWSNAGTLRNMDCEYMRRKRKHLWGQAVVMGVCNPRVGPAKHASYHCHWRAHTEVLNYYEEWSK